jgi:hypothetical protein
VTSYGAARNLVPDINHRRKKPFHLSNDNQLYFASNARFRGLDIYVAQIFANNSFFRGTKYWFSIADKMILVSYLIVTAVTFFYLNRPGGQGDDDITNLLK